MSSRCSFFFLQLKTRKGCIDSKRNPIYCAAVSPNLDHRRCSFVSSFQQTKRSSRNIRVNRIFTTIGVMKNANQRVDPFFLFGSRKEQRGKPDCIWNSYYNSLRSGWSLNEVLQNLYWIFNLVQNFHKKKLF